MAVLKYDVEVMQSVKNDYTSCIKDMKSLKKKMQNMVSEIKLGIRIYVKYLSY